MAEHLPATAQDLTGKSRGLLDWRSLRFGVLGACAILFVTACAGYRLGPPSGLAAREKTVYVAPFVNKTLEPRLSEAVTQALRKRLSQEGTFRLVTRGAADIVVSGTLTKYDRQAVAYEYGDVITARDFEAFATAHVVAKPATGGAPLVDCEVRGHATFRIGADQTTSERLALPALADDLARRVAALLTDGTW
ncbi:MAG: LptE family protein [Verrucomicrobia bacterium]|nr:LptE family protein [Verrucomicrobiota bacterium]